MWRTLAVALPTLVRDLAGICGAALMAYGAWLIYQPAGFVVGGLLLLVGVIMSARAG